MAQTIFQQWEQMNPDHPQSRQIGQQMWDFLQSGRAFSQYQIDAWQAKNTDMSDDTDTISLADL